jgi:hypothetical protein
MRESEFNSKARRSKGREVKAKNVRGLSLGEKIALRAAAERGEIGDPEKYCLLNHNAEGFVDCAPGGKTVRFVAQHVSLLRDLGIFEKALLFAFKENRINNANNYKTLLPLFETADPKMLRAAGQRLPGRGPFTLYRGVSGRGYARHARGFSWTGSLDRAGWFAYCDKAYGLEDPAVYRAVVPARFVLAYLKDEDEYVVRLPLPRSVRLERVPESVWRPALEGLIAERDGGWAKAKAQNEAAGVQTTPEVREN